LPLGWSPQFAVPVDQFMTPAADSLPSKPR
jgi:hypothetical protein